MSDCFGSVDHRARYLYVKAKLKEIYVCTFDAPQFDITAVSIVDVGFS